MRYALTFVPYAAALAACGVAIVTDVRTRKIPNAIPIALGIFAIAWAAFGGWQSLLSAVAAGAVVLLLGLIPFSLGLIGGGDVKLLAASAVLFGLPEVVRLVLFTALAGGVLALLFALLAGETKGVFAGVRRFARPWLNVGSDPQTPSSRLRLPYAIAISGGILLLLIGDRFVPALKVV